MSRHALRSADAQAYFAASFCPFAGKCNNSKHAGWRRRRGEARYIQRRLRIRHAKTLLTHESSVRSIRRVVYRRITLPNVISSSPTLRSAPLREESAAKNATDNDRHTFSQPFFKGVRVLYVISPSGDVSRSDSLRIFVTTSVCCLEPFDCTFFRFLRAKSKFCIPRIFDLFERFCVYCTFTYLLSIY